MKMKELKLLTEWADSVITESSKEGNLPISQDPIKQTQIKYPHLSRDEAASKYLDDITGDFKDQNAVINAQSRKSDKLEKVVGDQNKIINSLKQEVDNSDSELDRLKSLSGQLKSDVETRRISQNEVNDILSRVKELNGKPGMTDEHYEELKKKVAEFKKSEVDPRKFEEFKNRLDQIGRQESVKKGDFERLQALMSKVEQGQTDLVKNQDQVGKGTEVLTKELQKVEKTQADLDRKTKDLENTVRRRVDNATKTKAEYQKIRRRLDNTEKTNDIQSQQLVAVQNHDAEQDQRISDLYQRKVDRERATYNHASDKSRGNPYANAEDDTVTPELPGIPSKPKTTPKNSENGLNITMVEPKEMPITMLNKKRKPKAASNQDDIKKVAESIEQSIQNLLGPALAKYLK